MIRIGDRDDALLRSSIDWRPGRRWAIAMRWTMLAQAAWLAAMSLGAFAVLMATGFNGGLWWLLAGITVQAVLAPPTLAIAIGWTASGIAAAERCSAERADEA